MKIGREDSKEKAKALICKIIALNGGHVIRKGHIYKAFHAAHLYYYEQTDGYLSDYPIVKMPKGPGLENNEALFQELISEGKITVSKEMVGPYAADRFDYIGEPICFDPKSIEDKAIMQALDFVSNKDTNELAVATHKAAWVSAIMGEEIDIYIDTMTDFERAQMKSTMIGTDSLVNSVFG